MDDNHVKIRKFWKWRVLLINRSCYIPFSHFTDFIAILFIYFLRWSHPIFSRNFSTEYEKIVLLITSLNSKDKLGTRLMQLAGLLMNMRFLFLSQSLVMYRVVFIRGLWWREASASRSFYQNFKCSTCHTMKVLICQKKGLIWQIIISHAHEFFDYSGK